MLYLLDRDVRTVKWNGEPLHEATQATVKEELNGDFILTVKYPITDSGVYKLIKEDMLIKAPVPVLGAQLFRVKKPVENDDYLDITAYHVSDDVMQRSIKPMSIYRQGCFTALSQMVQNAKTDLGNFSFTSDISDNHTFNTKETETLYTVLMDGKHSIVGTWEGELVRDNFSLTIKKARGADRGVIITTHKNLKSYQRSKDSHGVVTRIHASSTFSVEGPSSESHAYGESSPSTKQMERTISITVDSPLIGNYPYINEKEYQNNDLKTEEELRKWAEAKFTHEGIDKPSDAIKIEAYEIDGQVVHMGDTVNLKSWKHDVDVYKKAVAYEFNCLANDGKGEYISITFDDKPGVGGSSITSGVSSAADAILNAGINVQEQAIEKAIENANRAFDAEFEKNKQAIEDGIERAKAEAEVVTAGIADKIATIEEEMKTLDISDEAISKALTAAGIDKAAFDALREKALETSETLDVMVDMVGTNGSAIYNRNRTTLSELSIPLGTDSVAVGHNGKGFEVGETYVISWEATCVMHASSDVVLRFETPRFFPVKARLVPSNPFYPTNEIETTESTKTAYAVYHDTYTIEVEGDWYQPTNQSVVIDEPKTVAVPLTFKEVADGNLAEKYIGEWSETPEIILDGGSL